MNDFTNMLNNILVETYHNIVRVEENFLRNNSKIDLSIREMHLIEYVGQDKMNGKTISDIAEYLKVAKPSVTVAVMKLVKKGYLVKQGSEKDGRVVHVILTKSGKVVEAYHHLYHVRMVQEIEKDFDPEEQERLIKVIKKLNDFFVNSIGDKT